MMIQTSSKSTHRGTREGFYKLFTKTLFSAIIFVYFPWRGFVLLSLYGHHSIHLGCHLLVILTMLMFIIVNFLVMFTNLGHIHSVILNRSSEHSSLFTKCFFLKVTFEASEILQLNNSE